MVQIQATAQILGPFDADLAESGPASAKLGSRTHLESFCEHLRAALGSWPSSVHDTHPGIIRTMVAATPILRSYIVFQGAQARRGSWQLPFERVPYLLLALQKILALAHEAGMPNVTYQTVMCLFAGYRAFLDLAGIMDCPMVWSPTARIGLARDAKEHSDAYARYVRTAKALLRNSPPRSLGRVLGASCGQETVGRLALLEAVSQRLAGRLTPRAALGRRTRSWRPSLTQWVLATVREELLCDLAARRAAASQSKREQSTLMDERTK